MSKAKTTTAVKKATAKKISDLKKRNTAAAANAEAKLVIDEAAPAAPQAPAKVAETAPAPPAKEAPKKQAAPAPAKKTAKKAKKLMPIDEYMEEEGLNTEENKVASIIQLFAAGYKQKEIIEQGFNKNTVYWQTNHYNKLKKGPITTYMGFACYEARITAIMNKKKCTREEAVDFVTQQDLAASDSIEAGQFDTGTK